MTDIIDRLMDFDGHGRTAAERVALREEAAITIFKLRADIQAMFSAVEWFESVEHFKPPDVLFRMRKHFADTGRKAPR